MPPVNLVSPEGKVVAVPEEHAAWYIEHEQYRPETQAEGIAATEQAKRTERFAGPVGSAVAGGLGILRTVTGGLSDVGARALGVEQDVADIGEAHPTASLAGETLGYFTPGAGGAISGLGSRLAKAGEGAGAFAQIGRAGAAGAAEGGLIGLQQGISELALSDDPLTTERAASALSSNVLLGAGLGGGAGALGKSVELGLARGKRALERATALGNKADGIAPDLAQLDRKGLRAAEKTELEAIEAGRVPQRAQLADDIGAHRQQMASDKLLLATKDATDSEIRSLAARSAKADKALRNLLDNPIEMAKKPHLALSALQRQQSALEGIIAKADDLRATFAADATKARAAALDAVPAALERNKVLQQRIADLTAAPTSARLAQITEATDLLTSGGAKESTVQKMLGGTLFGIGAGAVAGSDIPGAQYVAPLAGAGLAGIVSRRMSGKFGAALKGAESRTASALGKLIDVTRKVTPAAPILATKVLSKLRYSDAPDDEAPPKRGAKLADVYKKRTDEIAQHVTTGPDGKPAVRPATRQKIAAQLAPLALTSPTLADRVETIMARKLSYLAAMMPRRPDLPGMALGPDRWRASDMEMRTWARRAIAAEDPMGVLERAAAGTVTPEDAETMREVYPEILADFKRRVAEAAPTLSKSLPFARRLSLTILTGVPLDPALDPRIQRVLQGMHESESGEGMAAPTAKPNFGSVRSQEKATPAQSRAG